MHSNHKHSAPVALTIASSDSGAGAGIQADLLTFAANHVYGVTAIAALTAQNPDGVSRIQELDPSFLSAQLKQLAAFFPIRACKTGMLFNAELAQVTSEFIRKHKLPTVVDPVMTSTSGTPLLKPDAIEIMTTRLFPLATVLTPNLDEASSLLGCTIDTSASMRSAARQLAIRFNTAVLLKGGHLPSDDLLDVLVTADGEQIEFTGRRVPEVDTHGSGCTLSSAIAANLALGKTLTVAVHAAHRYLQRSLREALILRGRAFINHFPRTEASV